MFAGVASTRVVGERAPKLTWSVSAWLLGWLRLLARYSYEHRALSPLSDPLKRAGRNAGLMTIALASRFCARVFPFRVCERRPLRRMCAGRLLRFARGGYVWSGLTSESIGEREQDKVLALPCEYTPGRSSVFGNCFR